jgi:hypothetical protein
MPLLVGARQRVSSAKHTDRWALGSKNSHSLALACCEVGLLTCGSVSDSTARERAPDPCCAGAAGTSSSSPWPWRSGSGCGMASATVTWRAMARGLQIAALFLLNLLHGGVVGGSR